jgi:hypothetical protein
VLGIEPRTLLVTKLPSTTKLQLQLRPHLSLPSPWGLSSNIHILEGLTHIQIQIIANTFFFFRFENCKSEETTRFKEATRIIGSEGLQWKRGDSPEELGCINLRLRTHGEVLRPDESCTCTRAHRWALPQSVACAAFITQTVSSWVLQFSSPLNDLSLTYIPFVPTSISFHQTFFFLMILRFELRAYSLPGQCPTI